MELRKSSNLKCVRHKDNYLLYNSLYGNPYVVDKQTYDFVNIFAYPTPIAPLIRNGDGSIAQLIKQLRRDYILVDSGRNERDLLTKRKAAYVRRVAEATPVSAMTLIVTKRCNFKCVYCCWNVLCPPSLSRWSHETEKMSFKTAKRAIEALVECARKRGIKRLRIGFNGGEALLNWNLIERTLTFFRDRFAQDFEVDWGLNTNASLVTPRIASVLKEFNVQVTTSLDGKRTANDKVRATSTGKGTYDDILRGIRTLVRHDVRVTGIYAVMAQENVDWVDSSFLDVIRSLGISALSLEPDYTRLYPMSVGEMVDKIFTMRRLGLQKGIRISGSWNRPCKALLSGHGFEREGFSCAGVSGKAVAVVPSGAILACGGFPKVFGTIWDPQALAKPSEDLLSLIGSRHTGEISGCIGCEVEGLCRGGCILVNLGAETTNNPRLHRQRCDLLRKITTRLLIDGLAQPHHLRWTKAKKSWVELHDYHNGFTKTS